MSSTSNQTAIADLEIGHIDQVLLLKGGTTAQTKAGDDYLKCELCDKTGSLSAKKWNTSDTPEAGLYQVRGSVEEYRGKMQIVINGLEPADGDLSRFVRSSEVDGLEGQLDQLLDLLNGEYGDVVRCIFEDDEVRERFLTAPAATKNHHSHRGGLAEHTISMAWLAQEVAGHYEQMYGEGAVDIDLLQAGALLHDLGKIYELDQPDGLTWERQARGELVGHMTECVTLIHDACLATLASQDTRDRLIHMVLSHHGKLEWGSPVKPKLVEAQLLHQIDMMDSRFAMCREAASGLAPGEMSERVWALGGKVIR